MARYKNLYNAAALTAEAAALTAFQAKTRAQRQALYASHVKATPRTQVQKKPAYIRLFGTVNGLVVVTHPVPNFTTESQADTLSLVEVLSGIVTTDRASYTAPTDAGINILGNIPKFKFAKIKLIKVLSQTDATSRILGSAYKKVNSETVSTAFGRNAAAETFAAAVAAMKATTAYTTFYGAGVAGVIATNKIVITPEASAV